MARCGAQGLACKDLSSSLFVASGVRGGVGGWGGRGGAFAYLLLGSLI